MAINRMSLLDLIHKTGVKGDFDLLREGLKVLAQAIMELEVAEKTGAERYERSEKRVTSRDGYRSREWNTRAGTLDLQIPKLRQGSYFPSLLEPRKKAEQGWWAFCKRPMSLESAPARSMTWSRAWG